MSDFYPRSPCGERPAERLFVIAQRAISIHALLAESDADADIAVHDGILFLSTLSLRRATLPAQMGGHRPMISIHALLAESDCPCWPPWQRACVFLSTLSLRRATGRAGRPPARLPDFYPRSPCGERHRRRCCCNPTTGYFYPRSPCGERPFCQPLLASVMQFLSTLSLRRATAANVL